MTNSTMSPGLIREAVLNILILHQEVLDLDIRLAQLDIDKIRPINSLMEVLDDYATAKPIDLGRTQIAPYYGKSAVLRKKQKLHRLEARKALYVKAEAELRQGKHTLAIEALQVMAGDEAKRIGESVKHMRIAMLLLALTEDLSLCMTEGP
jgi:hypothetical protein